MANSGAGKPALLDVRQIGPNNERDISGVCSICRTIFLTGVRAPKIPSREQLEDALLDVFQRHVAEAHTAHAEIETQSTTCELPQQQAPPLRRARSR